MTTETLKKANHLQARIERYSELLDNAKTGATMIAGARPRRELIISEEAVGKDVYDHVRGVIAADIQGQINELTAELELL